MKLAFLLFIFLPCTVVGQSIKRFPFQVLDSENATYKKKEIKRLDFLGKNKISLKDGNLYIVHYTGLPFHIKGDTMVNLKTLNDQLRDFNMIESKRPNLEYLFNGNVKIPGMIHDYHPIILIPPPRTRNPISHNVDDPLYLKWPKGLGRASIAVKNIFGDSLKSFETESANFWIESKELRLLSQLDYMLIVELTVDNSLEEKVFKLVKSSAGHSLNKFNFTEAIEAMMLAYYFEKAMLQVEAEKHYRLAITLSDNHVFEEVLRTYLKRKQ